MHEDLNSNPSTGKKKRERTEMPTVIFNAASISEENKSDHCIIK
jgi:hypothetical protein